MISRSEGCGRGVCAVRKPVASRQSTAHARASASTWITTWWEGYQQARDAMTEAMFLGVYASPLLQAMVGLRTPTCHRAADRPRTGARGRRGQDADGNERRFEVGGLPHAVLRALIYVRMPEPASMNAASPPCRQYRAMQPAERSHEHGRVEGLPQGTVPLRRPGRRARRARHPAPAARQRARRAGPRSTPCCRYSARAAPYVGPGSAADLDRMSKTLFGLDGVGTAAGGLKTAMTGSSLSPLAFTRM